MISAIFLLSVIGFIATAAAGSYWLFKVLWKIEDSSI